MDQNLDEFLRLLNKAIVLAEDICSESEKRNNILLASQASLLSKFLRELKDDAQSGKLPRPSQGIGFGMSRAVGEWADRKDLIDAVYDVENYYREHM